MDIDHLIQFVKSADPKVAMDIRESILLLCQAIDGATDNLKVHIEDCLKNKEYKRSHDLIDKLEGINRLQSLLGEYTNVLELDGPIEESIIYEDQLEIEGMDKREIPNYGNYIVDNQVSYNLYENFTHKCPAAFAIQGSKVEARQWKDVLLLTCEVLVHKDKAMFEGFVLDPSMQGKKVNYISKTEERMRKPVKLSNAEVYIETNMSANSIRNLIARLLKRYNIKLTDYHIFLRADYTDLH